MLGLARRSSVTRKFAAGAYTFTNAEASAVAARMTTAPSNTYKALIDNFFTAVKPSILAKSDAIYFFASETSQGALLNWVSGSYGTATLSGTMPFTADYGFAGSGSAYINSNVALNRSGNFFTQNSATVALWSLTSLSSGSPAAGGAGSSVLLQPLNGSTVSASINDYTQISAANSSGAGFFAVVRSGASARSLYKDTTAVASDTQASNGTTGDTLLIGTQNPSYPDAFKIGFAFMGGALTSAEITTLRNAVYALLHAVGAA